MLVRDDGMPQRLATKCHRTTASPRGLRRESVLQLSTVCSPEHNFFFLKLYWIVCTCLTQLYLMVQVCIVFTT